MNTINRSLVTIITYGIFISFCYMSDAKPKTLHKSAASRHKKAKKVTRRHRKTLSAYTVARLHKDRRRHKQTPAPKTKNRPTSSHNQPHKPTPAQPQPAELQQRPEHNRGYVPSQVQEQEISTRVYNAPSTQSQSADEIGKRIVAYTNQFRAQKGLKPVRWNQALANTGFTHSINMGIGKVGWGHDGFRERIQSLPIKAKSAAENLYMGNMPGDVAKLAVDGWIESPGHLKNLVGNFTDCGVGVYQTRGGYWYFTQLFATF